MWNKTLAAPSVGCDKQLYYVGENDPPETEDNLSKHQTNTNLTGKRSTTFLVFDFWIFSLHS